MSASTWKVVEQEAYVRLSEHRHRICRNLIAEFILAKAKVYRLSMQPNVIVGFLVADLLVFASWSTRTS